MQSVSINISKTTSCDQIRGGGVFEVSGRCSLLVMTPGSFFFIFAGEWTPPFFC